MNRSGRNRPGKRNTRILSITTRTWRSKTTITATGRARREQRKPCEGPARGGATTRIRKGMRKNPVKKTLREGKPSVGTWLSLGSITAARFMARAGFAWLTVDIEHSLVDWETATHMFAAIADAGCVALARVPSNRHDHIKRVLDNGAHGIVVPMVNSREEAQAAVAAALYPPVGNRSVGGSVHALNFGTTGADYYSHAND